jgi:hypothetical protein
MSTQPDLDDEAARATEMLRGRAVKQVWRHRLTEIGIEFEDGTRLFIDSAAALELSITGFDDSQEH